MATCEIKNRWTDEVQYTCELPAEIADKSYSKQLGFAVRSAVEAGANLAGANLTDANLAVAYLTDANGEKLTLIGPRPYFQLGPIGGESRQFIAYITDHGLYLRAGCFFGTRDEFLVKLRETHGDNAHAQEYTAALALIDAHADLWTPAQVQEVAE